MTNPIIRILLITFVINDRVHTNIQIHLQIHYMKYNILHEYNRNTAEHHKSECSLLEIHSQMEMFAGDFHNFRDFRLSDLLTLTPWPLVKFHEIIKRTVLLP